MVLLNAAYVEINQIEGIIVSKQKRIPAQDTIVINGRAATTVSGARKILTARAKALGSTREYSRDAVYRMLLDERLEAVRTPSANYYFVDDLEKVRIDPSRGKTGKNYPEEVKKKALELSEQGLTQRAIADQIGVSFQTVGYWIRTNRDKEQILPRTIGE